MKKRKTIRLTESTLKHIIREYLEKIWYEPTDRDLELECAEKSKLLFWFDPENTQIIMDGKQDRENDELIPLFIYPELTKYKIGYTINDISWAFDVEPSQTDLIERLNNQFGDIVDKFVDDNYTQLEQLMYKSVPRARF